MFKIGDTVSCAGFGLGTILEIEQQELLGRAQNFYVVANLNRTEKIKISATGQAKIRELPENKDLEYIIAVLNGNELTSIEGTNRTFYLNLVKEFKIGTLESTALVVRSMAEKTKNRKLRVEEKKLFDKAFKQLIEEMAFVRDIGLTEVEKIVYSALGVPTIK